MGMIAIIPAKMNSRRCPNKNYRPFVRDSLVERAVSCAENSGLFSAIWLSTGDTFDLDSATYNRLLDLKFRWHTRRKVLCEDGVETASVVFDVLAAADYPESFCVLNPTSPLRTPEMLREIYDFFKVLNICTMTYCNGQHDGTAIFCKTLDFLKRPDFHRMKKVMYEVPAINSIDINTPEEFERAERIVRERESVSSSA